MLAPRKTLWSTPLEAVDCAIDLLDVSDRDLVYDIGCGDGKFLIRCAQRTGSRCVGIEIDPQRAEEAKQAVEQAGLSERITILVGNGLEQSLQDATAIFLYVIPRGLRLLLPMLQALARPVSVVTYMAGFKELVPVRVERCTPAHQPGAAWPLYLYHINQPPVLEPS